MQNMLKCFKSRKSWQFYYFPSDSGFKSSFKALRNAREICFSYRLETESSMCVNLLIIGVWHSNPLVRYRVLNVTFSTSMLRSGHFLLTSLLFYYALYVKECKVGSRLLNPKHRGKDGRKGEYIHWEIVCAFKTSHTSSTPFSWQI